MGQIETGDRATESVAPMQADTLAAAQGVKPFDWDEVMSRAAVWPEGESVDEFLEDRERRRQAGRRRRDLDA